MASWTQVEQEVPEFAAMVRERFDAHRHKLLATLRKDGSPRLSGIEVSFANGDVWLGMMAGSLKARDLQRDPRLALHTSSDDPPEDETAWPGDAKLSGRGEEIADSQRVHDVLAAAGAGDDAHQQLHLFRVDISEVVLTHVGDPADHLVIELWREGEGLRRMRRE